MPGRARWSGTDSTSINLYKVLHAALSIARQQTPGRMIVPSERSNFPTGLSTSPKGCVARGYELKLIEVDVLLEALNAGVAVLMLLR